jgi:inactivated superfamily I helicase
MLRTRHTGRSSFVQLPSTCVNGQDLKAKMGVCRTETARPAELPCNGVHVFTTARIIRKLYQLLVAVLILPEALLLGHKTPVEGDLQSSGAKD